MERLIRGSLLGLSLALGLITSAAAQEWPAYGGYGYGAGFDYARNPYSYPRPGFAQGPSVPDDTQALYGGYMPNAYYTGAAYTINRASLFPSGRAYCQTAGSYLYCADVESGSGYVLSARGGASERVPFVPPADRASDGAFRGILSTRTVGDNSFLVGTLSSAAGADIVINCNGPLAETTVALSCR